MYDILSLAARARQAALELAVSPIENRNAALLSIADALDRGSEAIFAANGEDLSRSEAEGLAAPLMKRLRFDRPKLDDVLAGLRALATLPDPIGQTQRATELAPGLRLYRVACPMGVVGVVFESRPDALVQIASLCLKSGNAVLLKGGREALNTNRALHEAITAGTQAAGMPEGWAGLLESREDVTALLKLDEFVDLIIPRGSNAFVRHIMDNSRIPVLGHADGLCHTYVDAEADLAMALRVAVDAKAQYPAVCNATETLLCHSAVAAEFLPMLYDGMAQAGVTIKGCPRTCALIAAQPAEEADFDTEWLDLTLSVRVVDGLEEAIAHINGHGSHHTDAILTGDEAAAARFLEGVDSAGVFWNCSTRFADGYRYGLGAEVGISTGKLHARGPMGLEGLTIYKYKLLGHGQTVTDFSQGGQRFTHRTLDEDCPV